MFEDYIIYMDMMSNGKPEDKSKISFMMCDISGNGQVCREEYREFCHRFLEMYEELMGTKIAISEHQDKIIEDQFN